MPPWFIGCFPDSKRHITMQARFLTKKIEEITIFRGDLSGEGYAKPG
jgi:hypothetical protein